MPRAERDLSELYERINAASSDAALAWYLGLKRSIRCLRNNPSRCSVTPEDNNLRHLLYGNKPHIYRVIFRISAEAKAVEILHIRHGARREFDPAETSSPG